MRVIHNVIRRLFQTGSGLLCLLMLALPQTPVLASEWAGSAACHTCHRDRFGTWHRTYHRTMTQLATQESVQGAFDGQTVQQWGIDVRPVQRGDEYWFEYRLPDSDALLVEQKIYKTVGSNRYQQYLTRDPDGGNFYRLHMLWHNQDERWIHMNAAFLGPDEQQFDDQVSVWNNNCIFCHNTGPEPNVTNYDELLKRAAAGETVDAQFEGEFDSSVAELGISCESCHGPSADHVAKHSNWLTRLFYTLTDTPDDTVVHPNKLDQQASTQVCGQCHGQRIPVSVEVMREFIKTGPIYRAGDNLFDSVELVWPESQLPVGGHMGDLFTLRFWPDRTPRLTAYEYQGLLQSECYQESEMTCGTCHNMHKGDTHGMITEENRTNQPCLACHQPIAEDVVAHTHHPEDSPGSLCYNCHMPEVVYGVMEIHRSHRIEVPRPARNAADGRPNACSLCHLDQSVEWAEQQTEALWGVQAQPVQRADGLEAGLADGVARLHAGDPVERAVTATMIGRSIQRGQVEQPAQWRWHLLHAMNDEYPAVRRFALRSLNQLEQHLGGPVPSVAGALSAFDSLLLGAERAEPLIALMQAYAALPSVQVSSDSMQSSRDADFNAMIRRLQAVGEQRSEAINIGE